LLLAQTKRLNTIDGQYRKELDKQGSEIKEQFEEQHRLQNEKTINALKPQLKSAMKECNKKRKHSVIKKREAEGQHLIMQKLTGKPVPWNSDTDDFFSDFDEKEHESELLVAPNPKFAFSTENEDTNGCDPTEITIINNHRHYFNQQPEFLVTFDNGERLWSSRKNVFKDAKDLLTAYLQKYNLFGTDFAPRTIRTKANVVKKKPNENEKKGSKQCTHDHKLWYEFDEEIHAKYCAEGFTYHGVGCANCKSRFVATAKEGGECKSYPNGDLFFCCRPNILIPAIIHCETDKPINVSIQLSVNQ
jgi:hypothetical protein